MFSSLAKDDWVIDDVLVFKYNQSAKDAKRAIDELKQFVKTFLRELKKIDGQNSSLEVFCRVDVGIFVGEGDAVSYFVNEVERGITTSLWVSDGPYTAGISGMSMVGALKRWVSAEKSRLDTGAST